jgi:glycosyltransferase involved in cell wall biosynthesis
MRRPRVLLLTPDRLGHLLAGPAMRFREMARALSDAADVTLASVLPVELETREVQSIAVTAANLPDVLSDNDVIVVQGGQLLLDFPQLLRVNRPLVVDLYDPRIFEGLHLGNGQATEPWAGAHRRTLQEMLIALQRADFLLAASCRQERLYTGMYAAIAGCGPLKMARVPCGIPTPEPHAGAPGFPPGAQVVLWAGGLWDWTDPLTAIRAFPQVLARFPDAQLVLWGAASPHPDVAPMAVVERARTLTRQLGLSDASVRFVDWVPYRERVAYLRTATLGLSMAPAGLEDHFAHRTRLLDFIGAGTPVVTTGGDGLSRLVRRRKLGVTVPAGHPRELARVLIQLLGNAQERRAMSERMEPLRERLTWARAVRPLADFVAGAGQARPCRPAGWRLVGEMLRNWPQISSGVGIGRTRPSGT